MSDEKTEAARQVLLELAEHFNRMGDGADSVDAWAWEWHAEEEVLDWMDRKFPRD